MPPGGSGLSRQVIGWALLGQAIWLPLVVFAVHDRWFSAPPSPAPSAAGSMARQPATASPLSLGDLETESRIPQERSEPAVEAASPSAPSRAGLVLRSPGGIAALSPGLPAGSPQPPAPVAGPGAGPSAEATGLAGGRPVAAGAPQPRLSPRPLQQAERSAAAGPGSRSDASPVAPLAGGGPQRSDGRSQLLGGAIGLHDLSGAPIGPAARPDPSLWKPPPPLPPLP